MREGIHCVKCGHTRDMHVTPTCQGQPCDCKGFKPVFLYDRKITPEEVEAAKERASKALVDYLVSQEACKLMREQARYHVDQWNELRRQYAQQNA